MSDESGAAPESVSTAASVIAWQAPWFEPYQGNAVAVRQHLQTGHSVSAALNELQQAPVTFVPQADLPAGEAYEAFIFRTRTCPTRENLHDLFNGLCWMRFPETKIRLNQLQAEQIAAGGVLPTRGPVRDALTVFDENAALLSAPAPLWEALLASDWKKLFIDLRPLWQQAQLVLFGHALLEKLVSPRKPITAHVYKLVHPSDETGGPPLRPSLAGLDSIIAQDLSAAKLASKPFAPMPVLGVPGWWPENENFSFYDDSQVFRLRRTS